MVHHPTDRKGVQISADPRPDTIAAVATPPGRGGVGILRVSGPLCPDLALQILGRTPNPRRACFTGFRDANADLIDEGIALYFPAPHSYTGEPVLELQGHGSPVVMDLLLQRVLDLGVRLARPGEFTERAFLNAKLDLAQAEAIADLIESGTATAARMAARSLQGEFSRRVQSLVEELVRLRTYVEAAIDFPEEEIDFLSDKKISANLESIHQNIDDLFQSARVGRLIREGMNLVIAGPPNAGKSSLMNALAGRESAIVTDVPGTTRDLLREYIQIDGMPVHIIDTAGLRESSDRIEQEGMRRTREELLRADRILWVFDAMADPEHLNFDRSELPTDIPLTFVRNKIDLIGLSPRVSKTDQGVELAIAAKTGQGLNLLRSHLKDCVGYQGEQQGEFIARRRHLDAISRAEAHLSEGRQRLVKLAAGELLAEELRLAQKALSEITGEFTADDLLGEIFSSFCIGK